MSLEEDDEDEDEDADLAKFSVPAIDLDASIKAAEVCASSMWARQVRTMGDRGCFWTVCLRSKVKQKKKKTSAEG